MQEGLTQGVPRGTGRAEPNVLHPQGFPIIFHGVCGEDQREAKSPSFFNTAEIEVLVHYLKKLLQSRGRGSCPSVSPKEIGIISPYRKQVRDSALQAGQRQSRDLPRDREHWDGWAAPGLAQGWPCGGWVLPHASTQVEKIQKAITCLDPDLQKLPDISQLKVGPGHGGERSTPCHRRKEP